MSTKSPQGPTEGKSGTSAGTADGRTVIDREEYAANLLQSADVIYPPPDGLDVLAQLQELSDQVDALTTAVVRADERADQHMTAVQQEITEQRAADRVLSELHDECRRLREEFYFREVAMPLFLGLIRLADHCRQTLSEMETALRALSGDVSLSLAIHQLVQARQGDLIQIEALLATHGVEPFRQKDEQFDPRAQKCVKRVACKPGGRTGVIAERLLPGYRRDHRILRPECVAVYVTKSENESQPKE